MIVKDLLEIIDGSCRLIIEKDKEIIYNGWAGMRNLGELELNEVKKLQFRPEINHKHWQQLGLMQPLSPEDTPAYSFSDLELRLYYVIQI